jgi:hypothetical protein
MAEVSAKTIQELAPNLPGSQTRLVFIRGTKAAQNDVLTVTDLTAVTGAFIQFASGAIDTMTLSTNVITLTSATTGVVSGLAWGT